MSGDVEQKFSAILRLAQVLDAGSVSAAAASLNVSQPALSRDLKALEEAVGSKLFYRTPRGVVATEAGALLASTARSTHYSLSSTIADIRSLAAARTNEIRVASTPLGATIVLPKLFARARAMGPGVRIRVRETNRTESLLQLSRGDLDLVICPDGPSDGYSALNSEFLFSDKLTPWVRSAHPLAGRDLISADELSDADWALPRRESSLFRDVLNVLSQSGVSPRGAIFECSSVSTTKALLLSSDVVVVWDPGHLTREIKAGLVAPLASSLRFMSRRHFAVWRSGVRLTKAVSSVIAILKDIQAEVEAERLA